MPERLPQILDRIGKEALLELRRRGTQINPFLLGRHHHYLDTALRRVFAHQIPLATAEGALRVAYWDQMHEFLRRSPVPQVVPLEWSGPLKDVVNVLVVGISDDVQGGLLVRPDSVINDLRRILHSTILRSHFDLICFPRVPLVDVPVSTGNLLRSLAKEYRTIVQLGWYDAAGHAGDRVVLYVPTLNDQDSIVQNTLFAEPPPTDNGNAAAFHRLVIAPTHAGNICTLIGDDVEHESIRDLVCQQNREADGIDIILNLATGTQLESPTALSRLCTDADAYGVWIQRGARSVLCAPGVPDRLGALVDAGPEPLPGIDLTSFTIQLAPLRRMRRARTSRDASPARSGPQVPAPAREMSPTLADSIEALRKDVEALRRSDKPAAPAPTESPAIPPELRASLEQISRVLATLGTSVTALADSSRASNVSTEAVAISLKEVADDLTHIKAVNDTANSPTRADITALVDVVRNLQSQAEADRGRPVQDVGVEPFNTLSESVRSLPAAIAAALHANQEPASSSSTTTDGPKQDLLAILQRLEAFETSIRTQIGNVEGKMETKLSDLAEHVTAQLSAAESYDDRAVRELMRNPDSI